MESNDSISDSISDILDNLMMLILYRSSPLPNYIPYTHDLRYDEDDGQEDAANAHTDNANANANANAHTDNADDSIFTQILNSSLNDKYTYKYILSEEGEAQLKTIKFTKELKDINNICPIMSIEFEDNQNIISLPCNHCFDPDAINKWVKEEKAECPVCRFKLLAKEIKIDEKNNSREDLYSLINLYRARINLINSLSRISYAYNPFSDNYFNILMREREIYEENNDFIQNSSTYTIFRNI